MAQKVVLGKGLASLLPGAAGIPGAMPRSPEGSAPTQANASMNASLPNHERHPGIAFLPVDEIEVNDYQPRRSFDDETLQELAASIKTSGIIQPLVVRRLQNGYQLIAGERRLRASRLAGLKQVPVVIRRSTDKEALELALIENIQRENLNCIDEALAYQQLMTEFNLTQEEAAQRVGKDRASVSNTLRLLRLPEAVIDDLKKGTLSFGHGKALLMLEDTDARLELRKKIIEQKFSVRQAESEAQGMRLRATGSSPVPPVGALTQPPADMVQQRFRTLSQELTRHWSAKVEFKGNRKKGRVLIHYDGAEQLERILSAMQNPKIWENPPI